MTTQSIIVFARLLLLLAVFPLPVIADSALTQKIDAIFQSQIADDSPGCNVGILRRGDWLHKAGYGLANVELDVALDGTQVHRMGSVSKQFTAMSVLLLADEGRIDLKADIRDYLPELRDYGTKVTVNAMLGHVAGMGDYDLISASYEGPAAERGLDLRSVGGKPLSLGNEDYLRIDEFYDVVKRAPLVQPPGQSFRYSNFAYFLLSMLVEEVSGESLREYAERRIFLPLGMRSTFFSDDAVEIVKNRAYGYKTTESGSVVNDMTNLFMVGDGGLHTTLEDMRIWDQHFYQPRLGRDPGALLEKMNMPNSQLKARDGLYANGQFISEQNGHQRFSHSGGWLGTLTYYLRVPTLETSLVLMCNDANMEMDTLVNQTRALLIGPGT